jgi:hypothetical protein
LTEKDFKVKKGLVVTEDIELGHATDTTIARASAGQITVEGTAVLLAGAQTGITSIYNTSLAIGYASNGGNIDFGTDNQISFAIDGTKQIDLFDGGFIPTTTNDVDFGNSDKRFKDAYFHGTVEAAGNVTVGGTAVAVSGGAFHDGFSDFVANEHIDHTGVSISAGNGLTGGGTIASTRTLTVGAGTGITVNTNDVAVTAAQTGITSVLNASLAVGRDAHNQIKFSTDDNIVFRVGNADGVTFKASGEIEATKFDGALEGNADTATALATARAINGVDFDGTSAITITAAGSTLSDTVTVAKGGTGQTSYTNGQLLIGNTTGNTLAKATLTAGSGISVTNGAGSITIAATGGGGASVLGDLTDVLMDATNFTNGFLLQTDSDGSAPTTGTLNGASDNIGLGKDVFAALTSGDYNIGIGNDALDALTTAVENVAIGYQAGSAIQGGGYNTVLGTYALLSVTSGLENVAIGRRALGNVSSGLQYNTAVGGMSGYGATGNYSVSIGNQAGRGSIGQQGVHVGALAGYNSSGTGGVNIGYRAGRQPTGNYNTFLGWEAGYGVSGNAAANNVAVGYKALHGVTTGGKNITIGYEAGDNITSGSNNVVIGGIDTGGATSDSQIRIANGDGSVTWIAGDENGIKAHKIKVVAITGSTTLTDAQSGSYVYVTSSGVPTLPDTAELGQQYTIINNKGSQITVGAGGSNSIVGTATVDDDKAKTFVAVATNTWFAIG